ncbi:TPA: hypothetical protein PXQ72_004463 [Yersinia enterocolitica]|nr:hypothetical protein [Yersinia enterocolitica]HDL8219800.1 hypothetical protein [Yersinia enterocolitica]HDL8223770.1 hypothetical protein [Yersinia enterocolitica]
MKKKPDLADFKDPTSFLEGGAADLAEKGRTPQRQDKVDKPVSQQKIFRLSVEVVNELKLHVARQQAETGVRTTETEIVEKLLRDYLKI